VVPGGKILIIEQISSPTAEDVEFRITGPPVGNILTNDFTTDLAYAVAGIERATILPAPIRLGPGMTLSLLNGLGKKAALYGILMDSQDFFASVSPCIRSVTSDGSQLTAIVDARTTAPTRISGESSTNLTTWTESDITVASSASNPRMSRMTTPQDASQKFVRARAMRRTAVE
jgi:hypothetical protein